MTRSTMTFSHGDVVLVELRYPNQSGSKRRPALVLSSDWYHVGRREVVLAGITSNVYRSLPGDTLLEEWKAAHLPRPSVATGIVQTVKASDVVEALGSLTDGDLGQVETTLRLALGL